MTIGVMVDGKIVQRPYSVASSPRVAGTEGYEFYVRLVQGGTFTPLLWRLPVGHRMRMIGPKGKFMLEPDDDRTHVFISSGTGNAPFVVDDAAAAARRRAAAAVFLNGVSYADDLGYRDAARGLGGVRGRTRSRTSRPSRGRTTRANAGWTGRIGPRRGDPRRRSATSSA